ncbi:leucine-rich repeat extensin-like protein 5 [Lactuca sativa]|uniref:leucine-rich repeat extensin-like protein 5 n=1 Tax=Lactuca sativa TaxID=4236 RepID=UPI000CD7FB62|nr:leucine-rich repeat extensin-like protein 5 [Lactuca sativa]
MASLEAANTPSTPSSGGPPPPLAATPSSEGPPPPLAAAPSSGGLPPPLAATMLSVVAQSQTPLPMLTYATPPPFPNSSVPNPYIVPPRSLFFPNTIGFNNTDYNPLPPSAQTTNDPQQTTPIAPLVNGLPTYTHVASTNNTTTGPSVISQPQNHPPLVMSTVSTPPFTPYQQIPMAHTFPISFQPSSFYGPTTPNLTTYNNMLVQPFLAMQQLGYHFVQWTPNQDCLSRSVTLPFVKELLKYKIPNTAKLPHLKTYDGTTDPDSHIDTYEWTVTFFKLDE